MVIRRWLKRTLLVLTVLLVAGAITWRALHLSELSHIGAGYAAQETCSCLFVSARSMASCKSDLNPMAQKFVSIRVNLDEVTATALGISTATSRYHKGLGCSLKD
jgi:hypothetical protein